MRFRAEIEVADNADLLTIQEAMLSAHWIELKSKRAVMDMTDLSGRCGSCKFFCPRRYGNCESLGDCLKGRKNHRPRTNPACTEYKRKED